MKAIVLLSGGLDSATVLAIAKAADYAVYALSFNYGQRHQIELDAAAKLAAASGVVEHLITDIDLRRFGGSALTAELSVPKDRPLASLTSAIPITYVPARNTVFLSLALAWAEVLEINDIFIGVNAIDYSGYPDCRPEYIAAFERLAHLATAAGVSGGQRLKIHAPLMTLNKAEIIQRGIELGVDYGLTHSCYDPDPAGRPCRCCDACQLRAQGFVQAGLIDPLFAHE